MKLAVIYIRVSTARQADEGVSLEAQLERARSWCKFNGYEVNSEYRDSGISGKNMTARPGLNQAIEKACQFKAALVVYSLSRLARSTKDALSISERLSKAGADLVSLTENIDTTTAAGKMIFRMLAVLAEFERDVISERTKTALRYKKQNGERTGGHVPYGFTAAPDGKLVRSPEEQKIIAEMSRARAIGWSDRKIAERFNASGISAKAGGKWSGKVIGRILKGAA